MAGYTRAKLLASNTYLIKCIGCEKETTLYGNLSEYKYRVEKHYTNEDGQHKRISGYACSWTCYVKLLLEASANKRILDDDDVLLLLKYKKPVPWSRVSKAAWDALPSKEVLEASYGQARD